jgi:hypothetical protein
MNDDLDCHIYHLAGWQHMNIEKEFDGLGVPNLRELNLCLLGFWVRRYFLDHDKIWKQLVDFKYETDSPNLFTCKEYEASNFWKGFLWAVKVVKMGYRWKLGNGCKIRFWEDVWIDNSSPAIQFWEIYSIINEQNKSIRELWDGVDLKCSFRRCVDLRLFNQWEEILAIASTINFSEEEDEPIWEFHSSGLYSSHSMYKVINFRGFISVFVPVVWKLIIPPRVQFFLWLISKNKILTRDNLGKRRNVDNPSCLFCEDAESVTNLLFECVVAKRAWETISVVLDIKIGEAYESITKLWLCNKKFGICNMFTSAVCWSLWKLRNSLCFQDVAWTGMEDPSTVGGLG